MKNNEIQKRHKRKHTELENSKDIDIKRKIMKTDDAYINPFELNPQGWVYFYTKKIWKFLISRERENDAIINNEDKNYLLDYIINNKASDNKSM
jgi:hypothetical protein